MADHETGVGLAATACEKVLKRSGLGIVDIGLIVFVTQNPDQRMPQNSSLLAAELGATPQCASFDIALGCSGFVYGLSITEAMMATHSFGYALLVTCDPYSRIIDREDKSTNAVFGDAATATLVTAGTKCSHLKGLDFGTNGELGQAINIADGGAARPLVHSDKPINSTFNEGKNFDLFMDGRGVFNFVNSTIPASISNSLKSCELKVEDIDWFGLHQGSSYMLDALAKRARLPQEKVLKNINMYGNTVSSTIPLLLEELMQSGKLDSGAIVLVSGFGVGLSWATGIIEFKEAVK